MLELEKLAKEKYIVAVSGGVDSMVLLDLLSKQSDLNLIVAHFDHGIRQESGIDRELVEEITKKYQLPFVCKVAKLGENTSESQAREARYKFLFEQQKKHNALAIVTAHHKDDKLETAILNLLRGTGRKGLTSIQTTEFIKRPLINQTKEDIYKYAKDNGISWNEDQTNQDSKYKRNYVRYNLLSEFSKEDLEKLNNIIKKTTKTNKKLDENLDELLNIISNSKNEINRDSFISFDHKLSLELMASWLRRNGIREFDSKLLDNLTIYSKTLKSGQRTDVNANYILKVRKGLLALVPREC